MIKNNGIGDRIRQLRKQRKLTADKLAQRVSLSQAAIAKYENNTMIPSWESIEELAIALETSPKYLLFGDDGDSKPTDALENSCEMARRLLRPGDLKKLELLIMDFITMSVKQT